jgi:hypothetical protein
VDHFSIIIQFSGPDGVFISISVIQVSGRDGLCHFSIYYTGFRTRWFMSFQYMLYRFQDQMVYIISVCYTSLRPDDVRTLFYLQCKVDANEQVGLLLLRYSTLILFLLYICPEYSV